MLGTLDPIKMDSPTSTFDGVGGGDIQAYEGAVFDSMLFVLEGIKDGISNLADVFKNSISNLNKHLAFRFTEMAKTAKAQMLAGADDDRDKELEEQDTDKKVDMSGDNVTARGSGEDDSKPNKVLTKSNFIKAGILLALGALFAFSEQITKALAPVLKFVKEKVFPVAVDLIKKVINGLKNAFNYLYENVWPFIKDNLIMNAVDFVKESFQGLVDLFGDLKEKVLVLFSEDATWWEKITAFLGIFTDIGKFFIEQFDRVTEFIANIFGVSFDPYDGLISYIGGKLKEGFQVVVDWFSETGTFLLEGAKGIWGWITGKIDAVWTGISDWFVSTDKFLQDGAAGIWEWITGKINAVWTGITEWFSSTGSFLLEGATGLWSWVTGKIDGAWTTITEWFGFGGETDGEPPFTIAGWIMETAGKLWDKVTGLFSFDTLGIDIPSLPNIKDMIFNVVGGMLPKPGKWYAKPLYYAFPDLKKVQEAFAAGGSFEGGTFTMPDTSSEVNGIETDVTSELKGATEESFNLKESEKGSTTIIDNSTTKGGDKYSQDSYTQAEYGNDHTDPTALIGQAPWLGNAAFK